MSDSAAPSPLRQAACIPCAKAKRRCSKHVPACRRCAQKSLRCRYPPLKIIIELSDDIDDSLVPVAEDHTATDANPAVMEPYSQPCPTQSLCDGTESSSPQCPWFLQPDSWRIVCSRPRYQQARPMDRSLQSATHEILAWLRQWVNGGSCPFIHASLYLQELPRCIQHAYTTTNAYFTKNTANEGFILGIIEDNCNALIDQVDVTGNNEAGPIACDTFHHLARTQALLIYQIIRLFDGDIRSRAQAEDCMDRLISWALEMWESASADAKSASCDKRLMIPTTVDICNETNAFDVGGSVTVLWRAWYIAESVRRTHVIISFIQGVYETLKRGWPYCPGGVIFTVSKGQWDAPSSYVWWERFLHDTPPPMESLQLEKLLLESQPADIDMFIKPILITLFGYERVNQWIDQ